MWRTTVFHTKPYSSYTLSYPTQYRGDPTASLPSGALRSSPHQRHLPPQSSLPASRQQLGTHPGRTTSECVCVCVCVYTQKHVCVCVCEYTLHTLYILYVCVCVCIPKNMYVYVCVSIRYIHCTFCMCVCVCIPKNMYVYVCVSIRYIHCTFCMCVCVCVYVYMSSLGGCG